MPDSCAALKETHQPQVLVETAGLSEKEWLAYRRKGIGGSDVAALLGISPWRTARDLYYDKLNIAAVEDNEENWVALEMGHLLEPLIHLLRGLHKLGQFLVGNTVVQQSLFQSVGDQAGLPMVSDHTDISIPVSHIVLYLKLV